MYIHERGEDDDDKHDKYGDDSDHDDDKYDGDDDDNFRMREEFYPYQI